MIKNLKLLFATILLFSLSGCAEEDVVDKNYFKGKDWTVWKSDDESFCLYLGKMNDKYNCLLTKFDNNKKLYLESFLYFKSHRNPNRNIIDIESKYGQGYGCYLMYKYTDGSKYYDDKLIINKGYGSENIILTCNSLNDEEIDMRCLYRCSLKSKNDNFNFEYVFTDKSIESGCHYCAKHNETIISLSFDDNKAFTITDGTNYTTGTYNATKEGVTLNIEDNHIFEESIKSLNYTYNFY